MLRPMSLTDLSMFWGLNLSLGNNCLSLDILVKLALYFMIYIDIDKGL